LIQNPPAKAELMDKWYWQMKENSKSVVQNTNIKTPFYQSFPMCENTNTAKAMMHVMDLHHVFNMCGMDAIHLVKANYMGKKKLIWFSSSVKHAFHQIKSDMHEEIQLKIICN
jgi:hypothetical protein